MATTHHDNEARTATHSKRAHAADTPEESDANDTRSSRRSTREGSNQSRNSIGSMISQSLAEESQQGVERVLSEVRDGIDAAREYVAENPREAVALAAAAGVIAWALLGTKPGRKVFEAGAAIAVPYATKWVARNMAEALR